MHHEQNNIMKMLFCFFVFFVAATAIAQKGPSLRIKPKTGQNDSRPNSLTWIDTTNMYSSQYGRVARLTQDNMPCIMPYNTTIEIPNVSGQKQVPTDIPNAWKSRKYPARALPKYHIPNVAPQGKYYNTPDIWKPDSLNKK